MEDIPSSIQSKPRYRVQTKRARLYEPNLANMIPAIHEGLQKNFKDVSIKIIKCPDLREWGNLADKGICGNTRLCDVGGVPYMFDPEMQSKVYYEISDLVHACDMRSALVIGAGAAHSKLYIAICVIYRKFCMIYL